MISQQGPQRYLIRLAWIWKAAQEQISDKVFQDVHLRVARETGRGGGGGWRLNEPERDWGGGRGRGHSSPHRRGWRGEAPPPNCFDADGKASRPAIKVTEQTSMWALMGKGGCRGEARSITRGGGGLKAEILRTGWSRVGKDRRGKDNRPREKKEGRRRREKGKER